MKSKRLGLRVACTVNREDDYEKSAIGFVAGACTCADA